MQLQAPRPVRENISGPIPLHMEDTTPATTAMPASLAAAAGHLAVRVEGQHPDDVPFLFEQQQKRIGPAALASLGSHVVFVLTLFFALRYGTHAVVTPAFLPEKPNNQIVWLAEPGPGGGGGGGGNQMKEPPRQAQEVGKDKITVPVAKPPALQPPQQVKNDPKPPPIEQLSIPAKDMASAMNSLPGAIEAPPGPPTLSQGSGTGGGAGTGSGTGIGSGRGSGLGEGYGGGTGGGAYMPGNGVSLPRVLREVKPEYTPDAMRAKVQGTVLIECIVRPDGTVGDVQVVRSLDPTFGLDEAAIRAAKQWRFAPGMRQGEAVPVRITIELSFTLR